MLLINFILRPIITIVFIIIAYRSLQAIQIEKIIKKNRIAEANIILLFVAITLGHSVANFLFSISDYMMNQLQLLLGR